MRSIEELHSQELKLQLEIKRNYVDKVRSNPDELWRVIEKLPRGFAKEMALSRLKLLKEEKKHLAELGS